VELGRSGRRRADRTDRVASFDSGAFRDRHFEQVPVQAKALRTVIQNHEIAEAAEGIGVCHDAVMNGGDGRPFRCVDFDPS
jgi:hypothetical protein